MKKNHRLLPIVLLAGAQPALAAFVLVDDFESYADGANGTTAGWNQGFPTGGVGSGTTSAVVSSALTDGQGLAFTYGGSGGQINYFTGPTIAPEGGTGTLFFQAGWTATGSDILFASGRSGAAGYGDLATLFRVPSDLILEVHNSGAYANTSTTVASNTVYNFWLVIDNTANTWDLYSSTGTGTATLIQEDITFRSTTAGDINTLYIGTNSGSAPTLDNVYIDSSGQNLVNPIPEPGSIALLGFAALGALCRRRLA